MAVIGIFPSVGDNHLVFSQLFPKVEIAFLTESANGGHSAIIKERPVETKRTANQHASGTAAPAGYTDGSVSPLPVRK